MEREKPSVVRDRALDAAEAVVVRQGIANLTFEAVAAKANISKGGLLHHFPSKDKLIEGMVTRCADSWRACAMGAYDAAPAGPGRMARALLSHLDDAEEWTTQCQQSSSAVFAALAQNQALIQPMRAVYDDVRKKLAEDGLAPGVGETVIAAMDGLWLYRVLGLTRVDQKLMDTIRAALEPLLPARAGKNGRGRIGVQARQRKPHSESGGTQGRKQKAIKGSRIKKSGGSR